MTESMLACVVEVVIGCSHFEMNTRQKGKEKENLSVSCEKELDKLTSTRYCLTLTVVKTHLVVITDSQCSIGKLYDNVIYKCQ